MQVQSLALLSGLRIWRCRELWCRSQMRLGSGVAVSCGVDRRCSLDLVLPWLWRRPAATALIGLLAWEPLYAVGEALKSKNKQTNKNTVYTVVLQIIMSHQ